jgi:hypothetical protein
MGKKRSKKKADPKKAPSPAAPAPMSDHKKPSVAIWILAFAIAAATTVPYLIAWSKTGENEVYAWLNFNATDSNQYFAWIREGAEGHLLFGNRFTSEPTPRILFKPFFLTVGLLARAFGAGIPSAYHTARILLTIALVHVLYWFASIFLFSVRERLAVVILAVTAGGIGLPLEYLGYSFGDKLIDKPIDFWTPEAFVFQILYLYPHMTAALTFILIAVGKGWLAVKHGKPTDLILAWLAAFVLAFIHPFDLVPVYTLLVALGSLEILSKRQRLKIVIPRVALLGLFSALPAIAQTLLMKSHPTFEWILENNKQTSLGLSQFFLGLGLPVILLVPILAAGVYFGRDRLKKAGLDSLLVPLVYLLVILGLIFLPVFSLRRRFIMGIQIPVFLTLVWASTKCFDRMKLKLAARIIISAVFGLLVVPGSVLKMVDDYQNNTNGRPSIRAGYYHSKEQRELYKRLDDDSDDNDVALTDPRTGNELPAYAGVHVFAGHWGHTVRYREKISAWRQMLMSRGESASKRLANIIKTWGITRVLVLHSRDKGSLFKNLAERQYFLIKEFENDAGVIYKVETK